MDFPEAVASALKGLESERESVAAVADAAFTVLAGGGVLHAFGTGHSVGGAMEMFHRAGGLVPVNGILEPLLSPFTNPVEAAAAERAEGRGESMLDTWDLREGELLIVFSNSGINPVPIDLALAAKSRGLTVVAVTSRTHSAAVDSRHGSGQKLMDVADYVLDNQAPLGDAAIALPGGKTACALSGVMGSVLANWIVSEIVARYTASGETPPVYQSANTPGGDAHNRELEARYWPRIQILGASSAARS